MFFSIQLLDLQIFPEMAKIFVITTICTSVAIVITSVISYALSSFLAQFDCISYLPIL